MISFDTNILLYATSRRAAEHSRALDLLGAHAGSMDVVVCELVLAELYLLLRNPAVMDTAPLGAAAAVDICQRYRANSSWRLVDSAPVMDEVWRRAARPDFARRDLFDARLALTLRHHGVTRLYTRNTSDFEGYGFEAVINPIDVA